MVEILQLVHEIAVCVLKNVLKFKDKHKKKSSGGVLSKEKMLSKILQNSQKNSFPGVSFLLKLQDENLKSSETATRDVLKNKVLLKISQISQEITCVGVSF